ncbi:hypothetical protein IJV79_04790 [bacterium]|nr:hypothetical protein [bacterium]
MIIKKQKIEEKKEEIDETLQVEEEVEPTLEDELEKSSGELFDINEFDFSQRHEKRRGERRRGYRRVDDRNLVSRAQEEADQIRANAQQEGYQTGLAQAGEVVQQLREVLESFVDAKREVYNVVSPNVLNISLDIAKKIVKKEIEQDFEVLLNMVYSVLDGLSIEEPKILINANPIQVDLLKSEVPEYLRGKGCEAKVSVIADESVEMGGVIIHTVNGVIDATIPTQFEIIKEALRGE